MRAVWKYLMPYYANDFCGFNNWVDTVVKEISIIGINLGFEDVDSPSVRECLDSHSQVLSDGPYRIGATVYLCEKEEIVFEGEGCVLKEILMKELSKCFKIWKMLHNKLRM